jgi:hypothetical protein
MVSMVEPVQQMDTFAEDTFKTSRWLVVDTHWTFDGSRSFNF